MENNAEIPQGEITPTTQEHAVPEGNLIANLSRLARAFRLITNRSHIRIGNQDTNSERPLSLRTQRAQLYDKFRHVPKSDREARQRILSEAHDRDEIARQYLTQGEVKVNFPGLGGQAARYTIINPPEGRRTAEGAGKPPIVLIPGISNDIDCVGALAQEIPFMGRVVIVVGMPESQMGRVTPEFAKAAAESASFALHADFFKAAINSMPGGYDQIELWGHSAGGPIIAEILNDPEFQGKVTDAVLLNPASCAAITPRELNLGVLNELRNFGRNFSKYTLTMGTDSAIPQGPVQKELKKAVSAAMLKKVCSISERWKQARVIEGGKIVVYSGQEDQLTRSYEIFNGVSQDRLKEVNPQLEVIDDPNGFHSTVLTQPQRIISQVFVRQAV